MLKTIAGVFGTVFLLVGVMGFIPGVTNNSMLLGLFHVNAAHNIVHILSGLAALYCAGHSIAASRLYFQVFGVIYGLVAILGFFVGDGHILGLISNNMADTWLHVAISLSALYLGFAYQEVSSPAGTASV